LVITRRLYGVGFDLNQLADLSKHSMAEPKNRWFFSLFVALGSEKAMAKSVARKIEQFFPALSALRLFT
jgi:hypothetical protein